MKRQEPCGRALAPSVCQRPAAQTVMNGLHYVTAQALLFMFAQQMALQQQLLDARRQAAELQERVDSLTPKSASAAEIHWRAVSNGLSALDAANSRDLTVLRKFLSWNLEFASRHIRPYVNPAVYGECVNQMTRGLAERIALLESESERYADDASVCSRH